MLYSQQQAPRQESLRGEESVMGYAKVVSAPAPQHSPQLSKESPPASILRIAENVRPHASSGMLTAASHGRARGGQVERTRALLFQLQQTLGNRAVQRLVGQAQTSAPPANRSEAPIQRVKLDNRRVVGGVKNLDPAIRKKAFKAYYKGLGVVTPHGVRVDNIKGKTVLLEPADLTDRPNLVAEGP